MPEEGEQETTTKKKRARARAEVKIEGETDPETVEKALRLGGEARGKPEATDRVTKKFAKAIRDPQNRIVAYRRTPPAMHDGKPLGDTYEIEIVEDLTEERIIAELAESRGGYTWNVKVLDQEDNKITAKTLSVPGEPMLNPIFAGVLDDESEGTEEEEETVEQMLERDQDIVKAMKKRRLDELKIEEMQRLADMEEAEARREKVKLDRERQRKKYERDGEGEDGKREQPSIDEIIAKATAPLNRQIEKMEEERKEDRRERDRKEDLQKAIEAATAPLKSVIEDQKRTLDELKNRPKEPEGASLKEMMRDFKDEIEKSRRESQDNLRNAIGSLKEGFTSQQNGLNQQLLTLLSGSKDDSIAKAAVSALTNLAGKGGSGPDPFTAFGKVVESMKGIVDLKTTMEGSPEAIPKDFPSLMVTKMAEMTPEVLTFFERRATAGEKVTKDAVEAMLKDQGLKMWQALDQAQKQEIRAGFQRMGATQALPAPSQPGTPTAPAAQTATATAKQTGQGTAASAPAATFAAGGGQTQVAPAAQQTVEAPAQQPAQPVPAVQGVPPIEDDIRHRVNYVLDVLGREMEMEVEEMNWPIAAWNTLPKDIRDKVVVASRDEDIYDAVKDYGAREKLDKIWAFLKQEHPKHEWFRNWIIAGIDYIKEIATGHRPAPDPTKETPGQ